MFIAGFLNLTFTVRGPDKQTSGQSNGPAQGQAEEGQQGRQDHEPRPKDHQQRLSLIGRQLFR
jgi:hypothetical protein